MSHGGARLRGRRSMGARDAGRWGGFVLLALLLGGSSACGATAGAANQDAAAPPGGDRRAALEGVLRDYIGLYAGPTLDRWKGLFHPRFQAAHPNDDGTVAVRGLEEFYERQRNYFATGRSISERLENVSIQEGRRIARVTADFVFLDEGESRRGRLGLHLVDGKDGWRIVGLLFAYDE